LRARERGMEAVVAHADELKPRISAAVADAAEQIPRNKDLARLETDLDLDVDPDSCVMGEWDPDEVRRLFHALEFRTLLERLEEIGRTRPLAESADLELSETSAAGVRDILEGGEPVAVSVVADPGRVTGIGVSAGEARASFVPVAGTLPRPMEAWLRDARRPKWVHDAKELQTAALRTGTSVEGVAFDTMLAAYLLDPAEASYPLDGIAAKYLGTNLLAGVDEGSGDGQLPLEAAWRRPAAEAAAVALLAPTLRERAERAGVLRLLEDVELPLARVLAGMQAAGVALDVGYLSEMAESVGDRMTDLEAQIYSHAGEEFNLGSPQQLAHILYEKLGLPVLKRTTKGRAPSTDADVLEKLRDHHPIIDVMLRYRELSKLKSTYLDALPPLVDASTGRIHTTFNQVAAATGRLSSVNPNLQNIPVRGELGRQIRKAFVARPDRLLLVADYSQIELRVLAHLSGDEALADAFASDADIHTATAAKVFALPPEQVDPELRRRAKVVNYGLAYGMNAYGLASRLGIPPDEAQEFIDAYFDGFPKVREFLDRQVAVAAAEGFTATMLGRRRYLPELQSANPRVRDLGRRMALNAPIQGSAADIIKLAMVAVDRAIEPLPATMVLTVHDELVFEADASDLDDVSKVVREEMESAYELTVPLRADLGRGSNWAEAAPAGH
ncbi:MAG TPA: DNA polymerase I, partial [Actinomycetota bacterium]|nr:DNA polymerase I [Actinomycetota bacterium]